MSARNTPPQPPLDLLPEVHDALKAGAPVLALESTLVTHGMPWPRNHETALAAERVARDAGAVPATIAVINGRLKAGLTADELEALARQGGQAAKASRRDLPLLVASGGTGGTTVAATMIIAAMAGIRVFATGGIGGVHRGAETTRDVSADLQELARSPVGVVCAGPKAILDIGQTLEVLETLGVPVIGFGVDELPAFYTRDSGFPVDLRLDDAAAVARALRAQWSLGYPGGAVIANPPPQAVALPRDRVEVWVNRALTAADAAGISGKALTPFLLQHLEAATAGESLDTNIALVMDNVRVGAAIAAALASLGGAES